MQKSKPLPTKAELEGVLKDIGNSEIFAGLTSHQIRERVHVLGERLHDLQITETVRVLIAETEVRDDDDTTRKQQTYVAWAGVKGKQEFCVQYATPGHKPVYFPLMNAKEPIRSLALWSIGELLREIRATIQQRAVMYRDIKSFLDLMLTSFDAAKDKFAATHTKPQELIEVESDAQPAKPQTVTTLSTGGKC